MNFTRTSIEYLRWLTSLIGFVPTLLLFFILGTLLTKITLIVSTSPGPSLNSIEICLNSEKEPDVSFFAACLRPIIRTLMETYSTSHIQNYTVATSSPVAIQTNCHPIQHIIGETTFKTSPSLESAMSRCNATCRNGCVHGVMGAAVTSQMGEEYPNDDIPHMSPEQLKILGKKYCESSVSICHGIGHIFFIQLADYQKSFDGCDAVASGFARETCYQGVFMEDIGGFDSVTLNTAQTMVLPDDYRSPCAALAPKYQHACFQFLGKFQLRFLQTKNPAIRYMDRATSVMACEDFSGRTRAYCFEGMGTLHRITYGIHGAALQLFCDTLALEPDRQSCTSGVSATIAYERAWRELTTYCDGILGTTQTSLCYNTAFQIMHEYMSNAEITMMCEDQRSAKCSIAFSKFLLDEDTLPDYRFGIFGDD